MKKTLLFLFFFGLSLVQAQEKVNFKKKKFYVPAITYAEYPCLDNVLTQTTIYQVDSELRAEEIKFKKIFFNIDGYIKQPEGKLKIYVTIPLPQYSRTQADSTYDKENKQWKYSVYSKYQVKINVQVKCIDKIVFSQDFDNSEIDRISGTYQKGQLAKTIEDTDRRIRENDVNENFGIEKVLEASMYRIQNLLNYKLSYGTTETKEKFEFLTSKEHSEYGKMLSFENEITSQLEKITVEKGFDSKLLTPHLVYLESLVQKYPESEQNSDIRFIITNNLAYAYLLLENKEKAIYYADLLIKNGQQTSRGTDIIDRVNKANFVANTVRTHTNRFVELKKLGFKIQEDKEDARIAFFEKIEQQEVDWEQEKINRTKYLRLITDRRNNILDSIAFQNNPELLDKIISGLGGSEAIKNIQKIHLLSKLNFEESNVPQSEEKWATPTNYLLRKKMPDNYYEIINGPEAWSYQDRSVGEKWVKLTNSDYWEISNNLDPINLLTSFRFDLWNKLELLPDETSDGRLCYHLSYTEKTVNAKNRVIPKTEYHYFIDKEKFNIVSSEKTEFEEGQRNSYERKVYQDYKGISNLNYGQIPHKILYEFEDYYGDTFYQEDRSKIEVNPVFSNRIFIKEVYAGGFR
ncbi:hypothetical protein [Flavobacterium sp. PL002]|uniref:hypothetical protein n=1 Tax=Flavobacterium sp. PL002 TaxID=1897058 RepID=UPI0017884E9E|nr:hypothetical protein [Flavobacterium sp. PL002]MBE0390641.1 hypothetical protein [Flavobacterium sp. PL002]